MFDETSQSAGQAANQTKGVEDIFAATDKAPAAPPVGGPGTTPPSLVAPVPSGGPNMTPPLGPPSALSQGKLQPASGAAGAFVPPAQLSNVAGPGSHAKRLVLMAVGGVVVAGGVFAGWWLGRRGDEGGGVLPPGNPIETGREAIEKSGSVIGNTLENIQQESMQRALNPLEQSVPSEAAAPAGAVGAGGTTAASNAEDADASSSTDNKADADQDGLTDAEETGLRTNAQLIDTDNDALSDWEEVKVWGTNPLVQDTDGDNYNDGREVQNGYNPAGPGKILDFEKAKQNIK